MITGLEQPDRGEIVISGEDATDVAPRGEASAVFQHYAAFKHMTVRDNVAFEYLTIRKRPKAEIEKGVTALLEPCSWHRSATATRPSSPADSGGCARQALAVEPKVLLLDSTFGALDARVRAELRQWLRRLHLDVHVTTVFVTHDQEEAMDVADQITVLNRGVVEQVGSPRELYEEPASDFVMGFVGPTARLDGLWVQPHDVEVTTQPAEDATEAMIERIVHLGFEVRVEPSVRTRRRRGRSGARRLRATRGSWSDRSSTCARRGRPVTSPRARRAYSRGGSIQTSRSPVAAPE